MTISTIPLGLATLCGALVFGATVPDPTDPAKFKKPVRIKAGDKFAGEGRLYPSPVLHDVDGDQRPDLVIGDLFGKVTFAPRSGEGFGAEVNLEDAQGRQLKFHNW